ncbi:S-methyl-5-thioribose-1-phosphate isomerase, partial [Claviceps purpurea]
MSTLQAVRYSRGKLEVLDQLRLPHEFHYDDVSTRQEAFDSIATMRVRGAPAIAIVASLGLAVELFKGPVAGITAQEVIAHIDEALDYLKKSRPTAVDLTNAINQLKARIRSAGGSKEAVVEAYISEAEKIFEKDLKTNLAIGDYGAEWLKAQVGADTNNTVS